MYRIIYLSRSFRQTQLSEPCFHHSSGKTRASLMAVLPNSNDEINDPSTYCDMDSDFSYPRPPREINPRNQVEKVQVTQRR